MTVMVIARLTIIPNVSGEVSSNEFFHVTAASTDHLDSLSFKNTLSSLAHITRKHNCNTNLTKHRSYSALASAALR